MHFKLSKYYEKNELYDSSVKEPEKLCQKINVYLASFTSECAKVKPCSWFTAHFTRLIHVVIWKYVEKKKNWREKMNVNLK